MQDFSFSAYFFPRPPQEWTAENICQANRLSHPLREWGFAFNVLGGVGAAFSTGSMVARKLRGGTLTSALIYFEITSLALIALGICFQRLASRHTQGLTHEHKIGVALDKLKQSFNQFPVLESEEELQKKLGDDVDFKSTLAGDAVSDANEIYSSLARVYYRPTKDLVPRLRIAEGLTVDQKVDLLDSSYHKGIILHFRDFEGQARHRNFPGINDLNSRDLTEKCLEQINQSFACSIRFLAKHLQPLDEQKLPFINEQLRALSFSWYLDGEKKVLNPCIYLEDAETVVIRGNDSEIGDPSWAVELLAPYVNKIKVERRGLLFVKNLDLYLPEDWNLFQVGLNARFPGKMIFVEQLTAQPSIWQEIIPREPSLSDTLSDVWEDFERIREIKKKQAS